MFFKITEVRIIALFINYFVCLIGKSLMIKGIIYSLFGGDVDEKISAHFHLLIKRLHPGAV